MMREPEENDDEGSERAGASFDDDAGDTSAHFDDNRCHPAEHDDDVNEGPIPYYLPATTDQS